MRNGNWATFRQCLAPWLQKNLATLLQTTSLKNASRQLAAVWRDYKTQFNWTVELS